MMRKRILALLLTLVLLSGALVSCRDGHRPSEADAVNEAAERLLSALRCATEFSLDGSLTLALPELSFSGSLVGDGAVEAGTLSLSLALTGERTENGAAAPYEAEYALHGGELRHPSGTVSIGEVLPLAESAERLEALLTLLPLLSRESTAVLSGAGVDYTADGLYLLTCELASLYRLLLLRTGQGRLLDVPSVEGNAAGILATHGSVTDGADGERVICFSLPTQALLCPLLDRYAALSALPLGELLDRLSGAGTADRMLAAAAVAKDGETLGTLLSRLETAWLGSDARDGMLLSALDALLTLGGADGISDRLRALSDTDVTAALRTLTGDPALSYRDTGDLLSYLLGQTPDGLVSTFDGATALSDVLLRLRETVKTIRLTVSLPHEEASASALSISFSGTLGAAYGDCHMILSLTLTLETAGEK